MFDDTGTLVVKNITGVSFKTTSALRVTLQAGAVSNVQVERSEAMSTLTPTGQLTQLHFTGFDAVDLQLNQTQASQVVVDNVNVTGRLNLQGGGMADTIRLSKVAAETNVNAGLGDDSIIVGTGGSVANVTDSLYLFGGGGNDTVTVDDASGTARDVEVSAKILKHTTEIEQLSRITNVVSLKNITTDENTQLASKLAEASVPYGQAAMTVDQTDLTAFRDFAAEKLLANLNTSLSGLQTDLNDAITDSVALLKQRDMAMLENQIKLYVRTRYYEG
ncbi:MAG: hypothetical protein KDB23_33550, partial [Planctomycetales bacterium]|nr:hypothetical protein [Planctomycetales bacterium]